MDTGTLIVTVITFVLFVAALFTKGLTHDLFLEAGVFLVSVKLILLGYRNSVSVSRMETKLDQILAVLAQQEQSSSSKQV